MPEQISAEQAKSFVDEILDILGAYEKALNEMDTILTAFSSKKLIKSAEKKSFNTYLGYAHGLKQRIQGLITRLKTFKQNASGNVDLSEINTEAAKLKSYINIFEGFGQWLDSIYSKEELTFESTKNTLILHLKELYNDLENDYTKLKFNRQIANASKEHIKQVEDLNKYLLVLNKTFIENALENIEAEGYTDAVRLFKESFKKIYDLKDKYESEIELKKKPLELAGYTVKTYNNFYTAISDLKKASLNLIKELEK